MGIEQWEFKLGSQSWPASASSPLAESDGQPAWANDIQPSSEHEGLSIETHILSASEARLN